MRIQSKKERIKNLKERIEDGERLNFSLDLLESYRKQIEELENE
jgi:hypothetical protein